MKDALDWVDQAKLKEMLPFVEEQTEKKINFINLTGWHKSGKTTFCMNLMKHLRVLYIDCEEGTVQGEGKFFRCKNWDDIERSVNFGITMKKDLDADVIVFDTTDSMFEMCAQHYEEKNNVDNMQKMPHGIGWGDTKKMMQRMISKARGAGKIVILITHVHHSVPEGQNVTYIDMNLPKGVKEWVTKMVDASLVFQSRKSEAGEHELYITCDNSNPNEKSFAGSRDKRLYDIHTEKELTDYIIEQCS